MGLFKGEARHTCRAYSPRSIWLPMRIGSPPPVRITSISITVIITIMACDIILFRYFYAPSFEVPPRGHHKDDLFLNIKVHPFILWYSLKH